MSNLAAIMRVVREFPEVIAIVDTVSSLSAMPINKDELGIDVLVSGSQKALALPPGLSFLSVSKKALDRAATMADRGYYFDYVEFHKNHEAGMTPSTPAISLIYALQSKLQDIRAEGLAARYARHARLNRTVRDRVVRPRLQALPQGGLWLRFAQLLRQQPRLRPRRAEQDAQIEAPARDRRRLWQTQGQDLPHFQHGRRNG
jgi:aspartate aminotransferase-like enzyme